jgi:hypothetical protein
MKMTKIAYNACFGGFSISHEAVMRYAELRGVAVYPLKDDRFSFTTYWTVAPDNPERQRAERIQNNWADSPQEERVWSNKFCDDNQLDIRGHIRTDPILIQVIEELGDAANGMCAALAIAEIPEGTKYRIDEYDGRESVMTPDDYVWQTA